MTALLAYHNDKAIKAKYLNRVRAHIKADDLMKGATGNNGKGCAVWCTLDAYDHSRYPTELGIPEWLARVEDTLFEGMSLKKSRTWPKDFLNAIEPGADLEQIKGPFLVMVLTSALETFDHKKFPDVKKAIDGSIAIWQSKDIGSEAWKKRAAYAARAAARAADAADAARAAARAADAAYAAYAAYAAARAADAARAAARAADAADAARAAKYDHFADELLKMLKSCKPSKIKKGKAA